MLVAVNLGELAADVQQRLQSVALCSNLYLLLSVKCRLGGATSCRVDAVEGAQFKACLLNHMIESKTGSTDKCFSALEHLLVLLYLSFHIYIRLILNEMTVGKFMKLGKLT